jgi:hypothetical protein
MRFSVDPPEAPTRDRRIETPPHADADLHTAGRGSPSRLVHGVDGPSNQLSHRQTAPSRLFEQDGMLVTPHQYMDIHAHLSMTIHG